MQSDIFKFVISCIKENLSSVSKGIYVITNSFSPDSAEIEMKIDVIDLFQSSNDKTGQRIIVDEKMYEVPAQYSLILRISFAGKSLEEILSAYGFVAAYLKDHNSFELQEYNWHGNTLTKFFLEPVIRKEIEYKNEYLHLDYRIELQLNSTKAENFVRVEKKVLDLNRIK